jgi:type I restriction enzyme S subunit
VAKVDELMKLCDELAGRVQRQREARERLSAAALDRLLTERDPAEFARHWQRLGDHFDLLYDAPETLAQLRQAILQLAVQGKLTAQAPGTERAELPLGKLLREESLNGCSKAPKASPPGVEILRISAGTSRRDAIVDENDYKWVVLRDDEREKFRLLPGDLLACRFNGNLHFVGRFSLYLGTSERVQVNPDKLIRFRVDLGRCDPRYVRYAMNAGETRKKLEAFCATTAGNIGISATNLKTVSIPVPPLAEQRRIVAKVDHLMSLCDALEAKLKQSQTDSDRLLAAAVHSLLNGVPAGPAADHDRLPVSGGEAHLAR